MSTTQQPEARRLAESLEMRNYPTEHSTECAAATELRRQHAEITTLQAGYDAARLEIESLRAQAPAVPTYPPLPPADKVMNPSHAEPYALWGLKKLMDYAQAYHATQAPAVPAVPHGWRLVPVEPTQEMLTAAAKAGMGALDLHDAGAKEVQMVPKMYAAMLAVAPQPPAAAPAEGDALEKIAAQWDGCMYDAVGGEIDIGQSIRAAAMAAQREVKP